MINYVDVVYFNTLYNRNSTLRTADNIVFDNGTITFHSGGHGYAIGIEYIKSINPVQEA